MKKIVRFGTFSLAFLLAVSVAADNKREKVIHLFQINGVMDSIDQNALLGIEEMKHSNPSLPEEFWKSPKYLESINWWKRAFLDEQVKSAMSNISDEELDQIVALLSTENGQKLVEVNKRMGPVYNVANAKVLREFSERFSKLVREWTLTSD